MPVQYELSWRDPDEHLFDVAIRFTAPSDAPQLILPSWRPGRYLLQNFAANVREWGNNVTKIAPNVWVADARKGEEVLVRYRYWAGVLDAGSCFLDRDEAYFNGSNLFMWVDGLRGGEATLAVSAPAEWSIETQLGASETSASGSISTSVFAARDYDHLIDSPFVMAPRFTRHELDVAGSRVHLVLLGDEGIDTAQYVEPLGRALAEQVAVFGELPCREYRFLVHVGDRWHGVEHEDSCSIIARRAEMADAHPGSPGYDRFLSICAHEFFHLWNVKRMLPRIFAPYDYTRATPTRLLWVMEGITSYYGDLSIVRGGVWTPEQYVQRLAKKIATLESIEARTHLSLAQVSFDGWVQDPARPHDKGNAWYSFYTKGEIVAALLDLSLRAEGRSLDEVMRALWADRTLDEDAVRRAVGPSQQAFFDRFVDGLEPLPYVDVLGSAGIDISLASPGPALGAKLRVSDGALVVDSVPAGSTAMAAGVMPDDELVAIAGVRTRQKSDVDLALARFSEDDELEVVTARNGLLRRTTVALRDDPEVEVELRITEADNAVRSTWLARQSG